MLSHELIACIYRSQALVNDLVLRMRGALWTIIDNGYF